MLVLAALMAGCVLGYRKLVDRPGARNGMLAWATGWSDDAGADNVRVGSRRYLGGRESVAVIHASGERQLTCQPALHASTASAPYQMTSGTSTLGSGSSSATTT